MGRKPTAKRIYTVGPIGVTPDAKRGFRIRWVEQGERPERTARSRAEAIQIANDEFARMSRGERARGVITFGDLVTQATTPMENNKWSKPWEQRINEIARDYILPHISADMDASTVTEQDIRGVYQWLSKTGYSKAVFSQTAKVMSMIMRAGVKRGVWEHGKEPNVDVGWKNYSASGKQEDQLEVIRPEEIPSDTEVAALLRALRNIEPRYYLIAALAATSGLRWAEIMGLKKTDFIWQTGRMRIQKTRREHNGLGYEKDPKTNAGKRDVVIDPTILTDLKTYVANAPHMYVFATKTGTVIARSNWSRVMEKARKESGFSEDHALHSLRHYAATRLLDRGVQIKDVSYMLGHANVAITTRLYIHGDPTSIDRIMSAVTATPPAAITLSQKRVPKKQAATKKAAAAKKSAPVKKATKKKAPAKKAAAKNK